MSHVVTGSLIIKDLDALEAACKVLGLEFRKDQKTYRWFGKHVGDYPLPKGFRAEDMGKCDHAISLPGSQYRNAYEVGVVKNKEGEGYRLILDFWRGGYGMVEAVGGQNCEKLAKVYSVQVAKKKLKAKGYKITKEEWEGNDYVLKAIESEYL